MSEVVSNVRVEANSAPYLRENRLFEQVSHVVSELDFQIFDSIPDAAREARPLVEALNDEVKAANLMGRAVRLKSSQLHVPEITLDPNTGEYTCRSKTADIDALMEGAATRIGPFEGFMYTVVPISQDGESTNGFMTRLCYQVDLQRTVSLPYISGNLCAYASITSSELAFMVDEEREAAADSRARLRGLARFGGPEAATCIEQIDGMLRSDDRFAPEVLRPVGKYVYALLDRLEVAVTEDELVMAKEAVADLVKARLWLTGNMSVKGSQVIHQYPSWLAEPHMYKFMGPQTVNGTPLDIGYTHHYQEVAEENRVRHENGKEHAISFMFSQNEQDGTPVTVHVPLDKITELRHV